MGNAGNQVCCHEDDLQTSCNTLQDGKFSCVPNSQCLDDLYSKNPVNCGHGHVCCQHDMTQPEVNPVKVCTDITGYKCLPIIQCNKNEPFMKSTKDPLLERNNGTLVINNNINKCNSNEVCCKPSHLPLKSCAATYGKYGFRCVPEPSCRRTKLNMIA